MATIRNILVAVKEPQARSQPAVLKAAQLAGAWQARLHLFHALATPLTVDPYQHGKSVAEQRSELQRMAVARLEVLAERLRGHELKVSVGAEWDFPAHEAIVRGARRVHADLVVAQCHEGRHRLPWLLRLTDWELVRLCPTPVLLVKTRSAYRHPVILAALDPSHAMDKPAVLDRVILDYAQAIQQGLSGKLHAMHAYTDVPSLPLMPEGVTPQGIEVIEKKLRSGAQQRFRRTLRTRRIPATQQHLVAGHPVDAIAATTRKTGTNIVVMGAISRSGWRSLLIGNTAERVLDELSCDVLVVKPKAFRSRVPRGKRGARILVPPAAIY